MKIAPEKRILYLKRFLVVFDTVGILLIIWLILSGVVTDIFRADGEGAEPTVVRMTRVCAENGAVMVPGNETACGQVGMIDLDNETVDILAVRMEDMDEATFREKYQKTVDYMGNRLYFAVTPEVRADLAELGALKANQILIHYHAKCEGGRVVSTDETGVMDRPLFAATYPKLDGSGYYCVNGNED